MLCKGCQEDVELEFDEAAGVKYALALCYWHFLGHSYIMTSKHPRLTPFLAVFAPFAGMWSGGRSSLQTPPSPREQAARRWLSASTYQSKPGTEELAALRGVA